MKIEFHQNPFKFSVIFALSITGNEVCLKPLLMKLMTSTKNGHKCESQ